MEFKDGDVKESKFEQKKLSTSIIVHTELALQCGIYAKPCCRGCIINQFTPLFLCVGDGADGVIFSVEYTSASRRSPITYLLVMIMVYSSIISKKQLFFIKQQK